MKAKNAIDIGGPVLPLSLFFGRRLLPLYFAPAGEIRSHYPRSERLPGATGSRIRLRPEVFKFREAWIQHVIRVACIGARNTDKNKSGIRPTDQILRRVLLKILPERPCFTILNYFHPSLIRFDALDKWRLMTRRKEVKEGRHE